MWIPLFVILTWNLVNRGLPLSIWDRCINNCWAVYYHTIASSYFIWRLEFKIKAPMIIFIGRFQPIYPICYIIGIMITFVFGGSKNVSNKGYYYPHQVHMRYLTSESLCKYFAIGHVALAAITRTDIEVPWQSGSATANPMEVVVGWWINRLRKISCSGENSMMTSSNGNIYALLVLCVGNSPITVEFPLTKASDAEFWCFQPVE